jgi:hypothetical protein
MANIFISYADEDAASVRELAYALSSAGYKVWRDNAFRRSDHYQIEMIKRIDAADAVVTVWSTAAAGSPSLFEEAARAEFQDKLIQVKLSDLTDRDIPSPFNLRRALCWSDGSGLRNAIAKIIPPVADESQSPSQWGPHSAIIWAGILGASLAIATPVLG